MVSGWLMAMMLPSVSLNQAVLAPPPVAMLLTVLIAGVSYSVTPNLRLLADIDHVDYETAAPTLAAEAAATQGLLQLEILW